MSEASEQALVEAMRSLERAIVGSPQEGNRGLLGRVRNLERNQWFLIVSVLSVAGDRIATRVGLF